MFGKNTKMPAHNSAAMNHAVCGNGLGIMTATIAVIAMIPNVSNNMDNMPLYAIY